MRLISLQTSLSEKERLLNIKENQITKQETDVTHLKKQLSTNRSYSITLEGKNRELQRSNMIATQRIEQLEMELQRNNAKLQQEYPHAQYPQNRNAYRVEAADMKVWLLEQKLRQLELDVHRNNTELLMMKSQPPQGHRQTPAPRRKNEYMNNANPSLRMPNTTHNRDHTLCDQIDDFLQPTRNDETF
jgi:chromosome segregation ATPase